MKLLTLNFLTCAIKSCKSSPASFPLHVRDAELEIVELDYNPVFIRNVLPRVEWEALVAVAGEVGLTVPGNPLRDSLAAEGGEGMDVEEEGREGKATEEEEDQRLRKLHTLMLETQIVSGKLVCGNCGHEYKIMEGIPNFLLPAHLV